jgi:hypothetical protein
MKVDCGRCEMRGSGCQDCVITALVPRNAAGFSPDAPGYLGEPEVKALRVLADAGLVPHFGFHCPARRSCLGRQPGRSGASPTRKRRDGSVTTSFPWVNRAIVME